jgi:DNA invertase Pin-like site-specific DNA recombinase
MRTNQDDQEKQSVQSRRLHGYVRVSTREQAGDNRLSLSIQEGEIRELARAQYPDRELIMWSDPAQSAWSIPLGRRKAGKAMLEALQQGDLVVASKFDRLFRSMQDTHNQIAQFQASGVDLIILQFGREPIGKTPIGKALIALFALIAELEADFIRARTAEGKAAKTARGGFAGGAVPTGKRKIGEGRDAYLVEDPREQEMLRLANSLREEGESHTAIAAELTRRGYRSRRDGPISRSKVYDWLRRPRDKQRKETASQRIREGLARRKAKGLPLGNPQLPDLSALGVAKIKARAAAHRQEVMPVIEQICAADPLGVTLQSISDELNWRKIPTARGGRWYPGTVRNLLEKSGKSLAHRWHRSDDMITPLQDRVFSNDEDTIGLSRRTVSSNERLRQLKEKLPQMVVLKKRGWSYRKLSREFGFDRRMIEHQFAKLRDTAVLMSPQAKKEAIIALGEAGLSRAEIMQELHVSERTVYRHLPAANHRKPISAKPTVQGLATSDSRALAKQGTLASTREKRSVDYPPILRVVESARAEDVAHGPAQGELFEVPGRASRDPSKSSRARTTPRRQ